AISTANVPASFAATTTGTDPGFVNRVARDLHLTKNAPCRNIGLNSLSYLDGTGTTQSGIPAYEYVSHQQYRTRRSDGQLDTGAYEYSLPLINSLRLNGNDCLVSFGAQSGNQYALEHASNLISATWFTVVTNIAGTNGDILITDTNAAGFAPRFYRIRAAM